MPGAANTVAAPGQGKAHSRRVRAAAGRRIGRARPAPRTPSARRSTPGQWVQLIARLGEIPDPKVGQRSIGGVDPRQPRRGGTGRSRDDPPRLTGSAAEGGEDRWRPPALQAAAPPRRRPRRGIQPPGPGRARVSSPSRARPLAAGALVLVVLVVALPAVRRRGRDRLQAAVRRSQPARARRPGAGRRRARREHQEHRPDEGIQGADHDRRRLVADAAARRHHGPGAGAVADERRQPLHRAEPGPNNKPALSAGATLPTSATQGVVDLDQLFNIFNPQTRRALQEVLQGSAEQYAGTNPDFRLSVKYFSPALASRLAHLRRAHPGSEDVHGLHRRIGEGADDDRRPRRTAERTWSKTRTRPSRRWAREQANLTAAPAPVARHAACRATRRLRRCPPRSAP